MVLQNLNSAANQLGMTVSGLRKLVVKKKITYFQNGKRGRIMFRPEWLEEFIEGHTHDTSHGAKLPATPRRKSTRLKFPETGRHGFNSDLCL
jgi:hypothetical protein